MIDKQYKGIIIPTVTPLTPELALDRAALQKMIHHFERHQVHTFVLGTTGEGASLPFSLKKEFLNLLARKKRGTMIYAGVSSNVMVESIALAQHAFDSGIDVVVATLPSYYALRESSILRYFDDLANAVGGPLMIYNIPATTHMSIPLPILEQLSHHPNIVGLKDSERDENRMYDCIQLWKDRPDFSYMLGWATRSAKALIQGADGLVPSSGNFHPQIYTQLLEAVRLNRHEEAFRLQELSDLWGELYQKDRSLGESLWALKVIMNELGLCESNVIPPLYTGSGEEKKKLRLAFQNLNKIENSK
jgi:dihydrodipicolinate synthase/N-acetylneuraminate lyase